MQHHSRPNTSSTRKKTETAERGGKRKALWSERHFCCSDQSDTFYSKSNQLTQVWWTCIKNEHVWLASSLYTFFFFNLFYWIPLFKWSVKHVRCPSSVTRLTGCNSTSWTELGACTRFFFSTETKTNFTNVINVMLRCMLRNNSYTPRFLGLGFK